MKLKLMNISEKNPVIDEIVMAEQNLPSLHEPKNHEFIKNSLFWKKTSLLNKTFLA